MGFNLGNFLFGGPKKTTTSTGLDSASQTYVNGMRGQAQGGANAILGNANPFFLGANPASVADQAQPFMDPYQQQVIGGIRNEYDFLRGQALTNTNAQATQAGAFGGSRAAVLAGSRMGELDRAQTSQIGNYLSQGWNNAVNLGLGYSEYQRSLAERQAQEPVWRQQAAQGLWQGGIGPYSTTTNTTESGGGGGLVGGAMNMFNVGKGVFDIFKGGQQLPAAPNPGAPGGIYGTPQNPWSVGGGTFRPPVPGPVGRIY